MKSSLFLAIVLFSLLAIGATAAVPNEIDWDAFSKNLTVALKSDNPGLQQSAMCMIIQYADNLAIPRSAVFDIVKVFRSDKNDNVRLLALVTLHKIEDPWAMDFLRRHRRFEQQTRVKQLCCCAVNTYYAKIDSLKAEKQEKILAQAQNELLNEHVTAAQTMEIEQYGF
ncbi:hypothetical protein JXA02_01055 [candidate division KSB1 bacterium]|nr:hypothetical protein [candidate division KSB1 bacterium]RQW11072.1 MAG: hypothetical protein EH222_01120 [candidate division KSB1 bacterium]